MSVERKRRRIFAVVVILISVGVLSYLAFGGLGENLVYYWSPTELQEAGDKAYGATIRLGGMVVPGSVERDENGLSLKFDVTDGGREVAVEASTVPPAMFREGIGVVVEGTYTPRGVFETQRLMVKHDNQYKAPEDHQEMDMEDLMKSMQFEETST